MVNNEFYNAVRKAAYGGDDYIDEEEEKSYMDLISLLIDYFRLIAMR